MYHFEGLHLVHAAHAVGFHRGDRLAEQNEVEAGEGLYGRMSGDVAVYLLSGLVAQGVVAAWYEAVFIQGRNGDRNPCALPFHICRRLPCRWLARGEGESSKHRKGDSPNLHRFHFLVMI